MQTIQELQAKLASGSTSAEKLAQASLEKIESTKNLNAFISVLNERALEKAKESDKRRAEGKTLGALDGIPVAVKDNMCIEGTRTTAASDSRQFRCPLYSNRYRKARSPGRHHRWKNEYGRICHGFQQRKLILRSGHKPA